MLKTIALWWCYVTGGLLALGVTTFVAWWAFDVLITRIGWTKIFLAWYRERLKSQRNLAGSWSDHAVLALHLSLVVWWPDDIYHGREGRGGGDVRHGVQGRAVADCFPGHRAWRIIFCNMGAMT